MASDSSVVNIFALVALTTSVVLAVFSRPIMDVWVAGQDAEFRDLVASLTRILLISPAVFAVSTLCSSVLNSYNRFAIAAIAPLMYNLAIIAAAVGLSGPLGIYGLALGAAAPRRWARRRRGCARRSRGGAGGGGRGSPCSPAPATTRARPFLPRS